MLTPSGELVHSDVSAMIVGPLPDGGFPPQTYPLESVGRRNPTLPNRLESFREFTVIFHDEVAAANAFPGFFEDPVFRHTLAGVRDAFMINYGSGGIGSEIIANRLSVGPMHDCLDCTFEEFFLSSHTVGDPAMLVDVPANVGLETLAPGQAPPPGTTGPKATRAFFPDDPSNVHHSYTGDFVKFRNLHIGQEQHVFHLHNHQWLFNPNDDNANYIDAQGIGPGTDYTYEINFGGSGNRNKTAGDAIFHCHFYPHFAQGMWELWRVHDVFEGGRSWRRVERNSITSPLGCRMGHPPRAGGPCRTERSPRARPFQRWCPCRQAHGAHARACRGGGQSSHHHGLHLPWPDAGRLRAGGQQRPRRRARRQPGLSLLGGEHREDGGSAHHDPAPGHAHGGGGRRAPGGPQPAVRRPRGPVPNAGGFNGGLPRHVLEEWPPEERPCPP
ncbi:hypothetical protein ACN28S_38890 [Cystobacter fuscus]